MPHSESSSYQLRQHHLGFMEVMPKPSAAELSTYYNQNYYGDEQAHYAHLKQRVLDPPKRHLPFEETCEVLSLPAEGSLLELAVGEGHYLQAFHQYGWQVSGIDFTLDGVQAFYPHLLPYVQQGDILALLPEWCRMPKRYDVIACNHLLEHVVDPIALLEGVFELLKPGGYVRIGVPNDDTVFNRYLVTQGFVPENFWVAYPDHLSYFNQTSFCALLTASGFEVQQLLSDFPIGLYLLNEQSNYKQNPSVGKCAAEARKAFQEFMGQLLPAQRVLFGQALAQAEIGRNLIAYCRKPN